MWWFFRGFLILTVFSVLPTEANNKRHPHDKHRLRRTDPHEKSRLRRIDSHDKRTNKKIKFKTKRINQDPPPQLSRNLDQKNDYQVSFNNNRCGSSACKQDFENKKRNRLWQIKDQILKQTGLTEPPDMSDIVISENPRLRELIKEVNEDAAKISRREHNIYTKQGHNNNPSSMAYGDEPAKILDNIFIAASEAPSNVRVVPVRDIIYFNMKNQHIARKTNGIVHLRLRPDKYQKQEDVASITIYLVKPSNGSELSKLTVEDNNRITVDYLSKGSWVDFQLNNSLIEQWIREPETNLGFALYIECFLTGTQVHFETIQSNRGLAPSLELAVEEANSRQKRFANNRICTNKKVEKVCCRYPFEVNFVEFQWDFIVAPKRYEANLCRGDCPFVFAQKYPHSKLLEQKFNNTNSNHGPCCGARDLEALRMIYFDGARIKISALKDMVVKQCSCT